MPTIVDFPTIVKQALEAFGDVFTTAPARRHFAEYLPGLIVAERKTISGINRELGFYRKFYSGGTEGVAALGEHDPALDGRVGDRHPALLQQFFDMPRA